MADTTDTSLIPGLPSYLHDEAGADAYAAALTLPNFVTYHLHATCGANGAQLSFDASLDRVDVPANGEVYMYDMEMAAGATLSVKNLSAGNNFADLKVWIW